MTLKHSMLLHLSRWTRILLCIWCCHVLGSVTAESPWFPAGTPHLVVPWSDHFRLQSIGFDASSFSAACLRVLCFRAHLGFQSHAEHVSRCRAQQCWDSLMVMLLLSTYLHTAV